MKYLFAILCMAGCHLCFGQTIAPSEVERIVKTLSADDMLGRPASKPEDIEKATSFIEQEFKAIGLKTFTGLATYRQEFSNTYVSNLTAQLQLNGSPVASENFVVITDEAELNITQGLAVRQIAYSPEIQNADQYFFKEAFPLIRDSIPSIIIVAPAFKDAFNQLKGYYSNRFIGKKRPTLVFALTNDIPTSYTVIAHQTVSAVKMNNVVGVIRGKTKPDEFVIFSGHYDHLGKIGEVIDGDSIANGADDDASGTTAVITLARYYQAKKNNARTLIFVAFTAEEVGGFGSKFFSKQLNPDKVIAMFNIEMIGKPSKWGKGSAFMTGFDKSSLGQIIQKNLDKTAFKIYPDPYPEQDLFYRSDNASLASLGVPAHSISTDQIDSDELYHSVKDEFSSLDVQNITETIKAIAAAAQSIVAGTDTPTRIAKTTLR